MCFLLGSPQGASAASRGEVPTVGGLNQKGERRLPASNSFNVVEAERPKRPGSVDSSCRTRRASGSPRVSRSVATQQRTWGEESESSA